MVILLHPTYTLRVEIKDRPPQNQVSGAFQGQMAQQYNATIKPHKFFDAVSGKTGCDDVLAAVKEALSKAGLDGDVYFDRFEHKS